MSDFKTTLAKKSEIYAVIDRFRAWRLYERYKFAFKGLKIIQIIGTNGKGSTGRFLAQLLRALNVSVAHYTSPHIFELNERFWQNGEILSDEALNSAHENLARTMSEKDINALSYFEYATFLAAFAFKECDFIIFEAGLGGEYDATSVFDKQMSIFTPISYDHTHLLGENLKDIARTKLKVMSQKALISEQQDELVLNLAQKIALLKNATLYKANKIIDEKDKNALNAYEQKHNLPEFLANNLCTAFAAFNLLINSKTKARKTLQELKKLDLRGRLEQIAPNVFVDVGHNENAAAALAEHFKEQKFTLVYNSFADKKIYQILENLKPIIAKIMLYDYASERALATKQIKSAAKALDIECSEFTAIEKDKKYLVFGSFMLAERFIKEQFEKT